MNIGYCNQLKSEHRNINSIKSSNRAIEKNNMPLGIKQQLSKDTITFSGIFAANKKATLSFRGNFFYDKLKADSDSYKNIIDFNSALTEAFRNKADEGTITSIVKKHFPALALKIVNNPETKDLSCHIIQNYKGETDPKISSTLYVNLNRATQDNVFDAILSLVVFDHINDISGQFAEKLKELSREKKLNIYQVRDLVKEFVPDKEIYVEDYSSMPEEKKSKYIIALTDQAYSYNGVHKYSTIYADFNTTDQELIPTLTHEFAHALQAISIHDNKLKIASIKEGVDYEKCDKAFRYIVDECFYHREVTDIKDLVEEAMKKYNIPDKKIALELLISFAKNEAQAHCCQYKEEKENSEVDKEHLSGVMKQYKFMEYMASRLTQLIYPGMPV